MAVIKNNTNTHTSNATLINVPDDGKKRRLVLTISRWTDGSAIQFIGVKVAFAGRNSSTLPDFEVISYVSTAGTSISTVYIDGVESGDVTVSTEALTLAGANGLVNLMISGVLTVTGNGTESVTPTPVYICQ